MNIETIEVKPAKDSINPELEFEVRFDLFKNIEIPLQLSGIVYSDENRKVANLVYSVPTTKNNTLMLAAKDRNYGHEREKLTIKMLAQLNERTLAYLEERRKHNSKGDITFNLEITTRMLTSKTNLSPIFAPDDNELHTMGLSENSGNAIPVLCDWKRQKQEHSIATNMWILSGDSGPVFLESEELKLNKEVVIKSSDWIGDYCPVFNIGKFIVYELPTPDSITGSGHLRKRINEATSALKRMEENMIKCEWNQVIEESRKVVELLRKQDEIIELLISDGYTEDASKELVNNCFQNLFDFASKFHHKLSRDHQKIMADIKASKEDANLIYALSLSVVNLISKKIHRKKALVGANSKV